MLCFGLLPCEAKQMLGVEALTMLPRPEVLLAAMNEANCAGESRTTTMVELTTPGIVRMPMMCCPVVQPMYDTYGAVACLTP